MKHSLDSFNSYEAYKNQDMNNLITIFRVVDKDGFGMYGSKIITSCLWDRATDCAYDEQHICPCADGLTNIPFSWYYGFNTIEQLKKWVHKPEWLCNMHNLGGKLLMISIPREYVWVGGHQVVFDPHEIVEVLEMSLLEI